MLVYNSGIQRISKRALGIAVVLFSLKVDRVREREMVSYIQPLCRDTHQKGYIKYAPGYELKVFISCITYSQYYPGCKALVFKSFILSEFLFSA